MTPVREEQLHAMLGSERDAMATQSGEVDTVEPIYDNALMAVYMACIYSATYTSVMNT
jgi:hypothetical protein